MAKTFSPNTCQEQPILFAVLHMPHAGLPQCVTSSLASWVIMLLILPAPFHKLSIPHPPT